VGHLLPEPVVRTACTWAGESPPADSIKTVEINTEGKVLLRKNVVCFLLTRLSFVDVSFALL
jgi:hypothetical protein